METVVTVLCTPSLARTDILYRSCFSRSSVSISLSIPLFLSNSNTFSYDSRANVKEPTVSGSVALITPMTELGCKSSDVTNVISSVVNIGGLSFLSRMLTMT